MLLGGLKMEASLPLICRAERPKIEHRKGFFKITVKPDPTVQHLREIGFVVHVLGLTKILLVQNRGDISLEQSRQCVHVR